MVHEVDQPDGLLASEWVFDTAGTPNRPRAGVDRRLVPESLPAGKGTHLTRQVDPPLPHKHLQSQVDRIHFGIRGDIETSRSRHGNLFGRG